MTTSSSLAFEQIGRLYERQNCFVQSAQERWGGGCLEESAGDRRPKRDGGFAGDLFSDGVLERGIMVLLEKQVHLQKDVGSWIEC